MPRFLYNANSLAIGGQITRPFDEHVDLPASCVLPVTGGKISGTSGPYRLNDKTTGDLVLAFDSAETYAEGGQEQSGDCSSLITASVKGLNVRDRLKADEVFFQLKIGHSLQNRRNTFDTTGSRFVNLTIDGKPFPVDLDHDRCRQASDYNTFKSACGLRESAGKLVHTLAKHPELKDDDETAGWHHVPDFGRIYFAEWTAAEHSQSLTMMRIELGSPVGGKLSVGGGSGNGSFFP
jgi:hypothetical protein